MQDVLLSHAKIVTPVDYFEGSIKVENGIIVDILPDKHFAEALNLQGNWVVPGCIDIHSDYIEKELHPRSSASFPLPFALHYMDARAASCGITTLFSAVSFSEDEDKNRTFEKAISLTRELDQARKNTLVRHYLHARIDPNSTALPEYVDELKELESLYLVVYNDSIPGQRQFTLDHYIQSVARNRGLSLEEARQFAEARIAKLSEVNHRKIIEQALLDTCILGSHDDTTVSHIDEAAAFGARLAEMPTTMIAAKRAKELDMWVCMGAPNFYRGGSHCGNLAAHEAMSENLVDMLCSDYHFPTLLASVIKMMNEGYQPHEAINFVSLHPARMLKFDQEIGSIEKGKRADLVSFRLKDDHAAVTHVWVDGKLKYQSFYEDAMVTRSVREEKLP